MRYGSRMKFSCNLSDIVQLISYFYTDVYVGAVKCKPTEFFSS